MDQGLKERLVGGTVLVVIAAWLVPWVLDGTEGGVEAPESSLQLPSAEEPMPMLTRTLKLGDAPEPSAEPATAPSETAAKQAAAATEPGKPAAEAPKPEAESTRVAANLVAEPAKTAPAEAPPPKPQAAAAGDWTVQLGSFEDEANARRLAQQAGTFGHKAEVSSYKNGARTLYRVRVGPHASKAAAEAAASALRVHGVEARVVAAR